MSYVNTSRSSAACSALALLGLLATSFDSRALAQEATKVVEGRSAAAAAIGARIDAQLERLVPFGLSGAALVSIGGETVLARAYGLAVDQPARACTVDTAFPLDSISKLFTAAGILALQEQGRLSVSDRLEAYFEGLPPDKSGITLHQLLTHSSGLISGTTIRFDPCTRADVLAQIFAAPLQFEPGTSDGYSNLGYSTLAAIIEQVSGQTLDEFLRERLFAPAGMQRTGLLPERLARAPVAHRYANGVDHGGPEAGEFPDWNVYGGSGVYSTVGDLLRWSQCMRGTRVLSEASKAALETPGLNDYGYGTSIESSEHGRLLRNHGGSSSGSASAFLRYDKDEATLVLLLNRDGEMFGDAGLGAQLEQLLWGAVLPLPPAARAIDAAYAKANAGRFRFENGDEVALSYLGGRLELHGSNQTAVDAFMGVRDTRSLAAANARAKTLLEALFANPDMPELDAGLRKHLASARERESKVLGLLQRFEVLGSVPDWMQGGGESSVVTIARMKFERGERVFRLHWNGGEVAGLGGDRIAEPCRLWCLPEASEDAALVAYHLPTGAQTRVRIVRDSDGRIERLEGAGQLVATRVEATAR